MSFIDERNFAEVSLLIKSAACVLRSWSAARASERSSSVALSSARWAAIVRATAPSISGDQCTLGRRTMPFGQWRRSASRTASSKSLAMRSVSLEVLRARAASTSAEKAVMSDFAHDVKVRRTGSWSGAGMSGCASPKVTMYDRKRVIGAGVRRGLRCPRT
eukprot:TRINITY_DN849_c1_g1_i3.p4 TRINITY_DN849_c1_g1~~TRINITY_DN849_c1_g1_i3.p4  ORF type:complete len:161 (-),score=4.92 TRINITY_DN849_c1_g1_i3:363-845(-)